MKIAACDDDTHILTQVCAALKAENEKSGDLSIAAYQSSAAMLSAVEDGARFDLYILDILMPLMSGMELAAAIRASDEAAMIVFLTSSPEFAVDSYGVGALDYLLKPVSAEKLSAMLHKARCHLKDRRDEELLLSVGGKLRSVPLGAILCVEALRNKLLYHLLGGETLTAYGTISQAQKRLSNDPRFIQPHRSYLVNMEHIREFGSHEILLAGELPPVPVSRAAVLELKRQYIEFMVHMAGGLEDDN